MLETHLTDTQPVLSSCQGRSTVVVSLLVLGLLLLELQGTKESTSLDQYCSSFFVIEILGFF